MRNSTAIINTLGTRAHDPHRIIPGDRIFVRLTSNGRTVLEFTTTEAASMTELNCETRFRIKNFHGLCSIYIRNMSQGWSTTKPLMLYRNKYVPVAHRTERNHIIYPWETH